MPHAQVGLSRRWLLVSGVTLVLSVALLGWFMRLRAQDQVFERPLSKPTGSPPSKPEAKSATPPPPPAPAPAPHQVEAPHMGPTTNGPIGPPTADPPSPEPAAPKPAAPERAKPVPAKPAPARPAPTRPPGAPSLDDIGKMGYGGATAGKAVESRKPASHKQEAVPTGGKKGRPTKGKGSPAVPASPAFEREEQRDPGAPSKPAAKPAAKPDPAAGDQPEPTAAEDSAATGGAAKVDPNAGWFGLSAPKEMSLGVSTHVRALLSGRDIKSQFESELESGAAEAGPAGVTTSSKPVRIVDKMRVELKADSAADFEIVPFLPVEQAVDNDQVTIWEWAVTPKQPGRKTLTAVLSSGSGASATLRAKPERIFVEVKVLPAQRLKEVVAGIAGALSAVAGAIGAWMGLLRPFLQRRRGEEGGSDGGERRAPRVTGAAPPPGPGPSPPDAQAAAPQSGDSSERPSA